MALMQWRVLTPLRKAGYPKLCVIIISNGTLSSCLLNIICLVGKETVKYDVGTFVFKIIVSTSSSIKISK